MNKQELKQRSQEHADKMGFLLQPNPQLLDGILNGLLRNLKLKGAIYCPCRRVTENKEENKRIICPCVYHEDEVKDDGHCKCYLFVKK